MRSSSLGLLILAVLAASPGASAAQAIIQSAREGDVAAVRRLLERDPGIINATDERQSTALHFAASAGSTEMVGLLLDHGADPDLQNLDGHTPLQRAAIYGRDESVDLLLEHDAALDLRDDYGRSPLLLVARESGSEASARALLAHGRGVPVGSGCYKRNVDVHGGKGPPCGQTRRPPR